MTSWILTDNMINLRNEFNELSPGRDKDSDGSIGDLAHQNESASSHNPDKTGAAEWKDGDSKNEVRAIDVDNSGPWPNGITFEKIIQMLVNKGRNGNLETVIRYMIYNRRIWRASNNWATETYTGPSAHTEHGHFTGAFTQAADENTTYNYGIADMGDTFMSFIDNQTEFNNALNAWASTAAGQSALHMAWRSGKVQAYKDNGDPDGDNQIGIASAITYAYKYPQTLVNFIAGQVAARDAALAGSISNVVNKLGTMDSDDVTRHQEVVGMLNEVLTALSPVQQPDQ